MTLSAMRGARRGILLAAAGIIMAAGAARAQEMDGPDPAPEPQHSRLPPGAVVQPLDTGPGAELRRNLTALAANPQSLDALIGAGRAADGMGDGEAALGFFARADEISPNDPRVKAGMASALVLMERPEQALLMFAEAAGLGAPEVEIAGDRGLAYDMVGDPGRAQHDYQVALRRRADPEIERRLALSLAISGHREPALRVIESQLRRHERAAWRTQAFVLALTGDAAGAEDTAARMMPAVNAREMAPFFARLPALSPGQKAAAVHFGRFPSDGRAVQVASNMAAGPPVEVAPRRVLPEPERSAGARRRPDSSERPVNSLIRDSEIAPPVLPSRPAQSAEAEPRRFEPQRTEPEPDREAPREAPPREAPAFYSGGNFTLAPGSEPRAAPSHVPVQIQSARPAFSDIAALVRALPEEAGASPAAPAPAPAIDRRSRDAAAREAEARYRDQRAAAATSSRATRPAEQQGRGRGARNAPPPNPARRWVQVATGANRTGLPRTFANLREQAGALLNNRNAYAVRASTTNRLLVGPFDNDRAAQALVNQLRQRRISAVTWTSEAGQEIERLQTADDRSPSRTRSEPERRPAAGARSTRARSEREPRPGARTTRARPEVERRTGASDSRNARSTRGKSGQEQRPAARGRRTR
jgi:Flp pilus assembly protein TadD